MRTQPASTDQSQERQSGPTRQRYRGNTLPQEQSSKSQSTMMTQRRIIFKKAKKKSLRISVILVMAFVICWTPYYFMMITFIFDPLNEKV